MGETVMAGRGVVLAHPGTGAFVQHTARGLQEAGLLRAYVTTFAYRPGSVTGRALRLGLGMATRDPDRLLRRRQVTEVSDEFVVSYPLPEFLRMLVQKGHLGAVATDVVWEATELWFDRTVTTRHVRGARGVYAYDHSALCAFKTARAQGAACIYEMPQAHYATVSALMERELECFPCLRTSYSAHAARHDQRRNARRAEEMNLSDHIVVNSSFTRDSAVSAGLDAARITTIPLGCPPVVARSEERDRKPFIFVSAGSQSVRKGTHYLLEAWRKIGAKVGTELWLVGNMQLPAEMRRDLPGTVVIKPTLSRDELYALYSRAGALVFPSLCEGFGMVITEAMARGLPVITTPHTAGRDLIRSGENGILVPVRDVDALAAAMVWCLDHPDELQAMGEAGAGTAAGWQWTDYRRAIGVAVGRMVAEGSGQPCGSR